ncbi:MAG: TerC family protein [Chloroflexi bacterium]|nr:TerC family protein [Chloroflexota bacterium]
MLALDLGVVNRKAHVPTFRESLAWTGVWLTLALLFNAGVFYYRGADAGLEFLTGYVIEYSLSVDNLFVFLMLFSFFAVPAAYQHRVLFWGIIGALVMRGLMIGVGAVLIKQFHWVIYLFGAFLLYTGFRMLRSGDEEVHPERSPLIRLAQRYIPVTKEYVKDHFFTRIGGVLHATPLFLVLIAIETTDLIFAVDSIPAIFAITDDPFIVYTSNVFAILGLRSLYFLVAGMLERFHYLKVGLAIVLMFVGGKMLLVDVYKIPIAISLGVVVLVLGAAVGYSWLSPRYSKDEPLTGAELEQGARHS